MCQSQTAKWSCGTWPRLDCKCKISFKKIYHSRRKAKKFKKSKKKFFWMTFEHNFDCRPGRGSRLMSRLLRKIFGISRLSRPNLGMSRLWRPKSSISRFATMMIRRDYCDRSGDCATKTSRLIFGTSRLSRPRVALSRLSRHRWRRRDFPDQHEDGATFKKSFSGLSRPRWRRHDFRDHGGYGATQETARLKKQRRDRLGQCDQKVHYWGPNQFGTKHIFKLKSSKVLF